MKFIGKLDPVPVAVHIEPTPYGRCAEPTFLAYLRARQPIGARDTSTLDAVQVAPGGVSRVRRGRQPWHARPVAHQVGYPGRRHIVTR